MIYANSQTTGRSESLSMRPVGRADCEDLAAFIAHLSEDSRRRYFMGPKRGFTPRELAQLTDVEHLARGTLVAIDEASSSIIALARYVARETSDGSADFAVAVADCWQRRGVGRALSAELIGHACENGICRMHATTLWDNYPSRALLSRLGFRVCAAGQGVLDLSADLRCRQAA